ncbi:hypothetical protein V5O48_010093 [Marasmius crinis-equi]|uniref:Uncharacterized protein n=1 Tax=Marasmius crinis-equi TaxID=585013 RepID=A0ABR3F9D0_9AGAR
MPRRKLYTTKEQKLEARKLVNQRHYDKHRPLILQSRKIQREKALKEAIAHETAERVKRVRARKRHNSPLTVKPIEVPAGNTNQSSSEAQRDLEGRVEKLKKGWLSLMESKGGYAFYLENLYFRTSIWNTSRRTTLSPATESPVTATKRLFDRMLMQYQGLEDEYFFLIRDRHGPVWQQKREDFTIFKEVVGETRKHVEEIGVAMEQGELDSMYRDHKLGYQIHYYSDLRRI